jgi:four helix bundle protein
MGKFENLRVWQKSKDLSVRIYKLTYESPFTKDYSLKDQIRRASVSVPGNIAEGDESGTNKLASRYFYSAKGSVAELITQIIIASEIGYISETTGNELVDECKGISAMLNNLIKIRLNSTI